MAPELSEACVIFLHNAYCPLTSRAPMHLNGTSRCVGGGCICFVPGPMTGAQQTRVKGWTNVPPVLLSTASPVAPHALPRSRRHADWPCPGLGTLDTFLKLHTPGPPAPMPPTPRSPPTPGGLLGRGALHTHCLPLAPGPAPSRGAAPGPQSRAMPPAERPGLGESGTSAPGLRESLWAAPARPCAEPRGPTDRQRCPRCFEHRRSQTCAHCDWHQLTEHQPPRDGNVPTLWHWPGTNRLLLSPFHR